MRTRIMLTIFALTTLASAQTVFSKAQILDFYGRPTAPSPPPSNYGRVYFDTVSAQMKCITSTGASCFAAAGGSGTVTSVLGTANQIVSDGSTTTPTLSIATTFTFPGTVTNNLSIFGATTSAQLLGVISDETGTGSLVFGTAPTITLANGTGLPISSGVSGLGTGIATFLATPSSANLATAVTDEFGTGSLYFGPATGTSGGIPYYSSTTAISSSGLLASGGVVLGGGAGTTPATSTQLTFSAPTLTIGLAGTSSGVLALTGSTSGSATMTAPATAGTTTNPIVFSNAIQAVGTTNPALPSYSFSTGATDGMGTRGSGNVEISIAGNDSLDISAGGFAVRSGAVMDWSSSSTNASTSADTGFSRDAAGVVDVGTGAQGSKAGSMKMTGLTLGVAGTSSGVLTMSGSTSGTATITAPATAGTSTNGITISNVLLGPSGAVGTPTYGFTSSTNTGIYLNAGGPNVVTAISGAIGFQVTPTEVSTGTTTPVCLGAGQDTGMSRTAADVTAFGNCTQGDTSGKLKAAGYISVGTKFTTDTGCGTVTSTTGGATAGSFVAQATGACTVVITMGNTATAPNGWACTVSDRTTANLFRQTASSTTTCTVSGTAVTSDVISFSAIGY